MENDDPHLGSILFLRAYYATAYREPSPKMQHKCCDFMPNLPVHVMLFILFLMTYREREALIKSYKDYETKLLIEQKIREIFFFMGVKHDFMNFVPK